MRSRTSWLRAAILPLLALAGLSLVAWGVGWWWLFYREAFVDEIAAIEELAGKEGVVEYRRQGETLPREYDATKGNREPVPWSVPFVGRVESVVVQRAASLDGDLPDDVRDRVLRLPGMRRFVDWAPSYKWGVSGLETVPEIFALGPSLPKLPEKKLSPRNLRDAWPAGEPVADERRRALARTIDDAWRNDEPARPKLTYAEFTDHSSNPRTPGGTEWSLVVEEGSRRLETASYPIRSPCSFHFSHLTLQTETSLYAFEHENGWQLQARSDRRFVDEDFSRAAPSVDASDPYEAPAFPVSRSTDFIGPSGERIVRIDRIDDVRYRIETLPRASVTDPALQFRLVAILRSDRDWGIERYRVFALRDGSQDSGEFERVYVGLRRLELVGGTPVVVEALTADDILQFQQDDTESSITAPRDWRRTLVATRFDPQVPRSLFDPRTYEPTLPEPHELSGWRTYHALSLAGAACLALATLGGIASTLGRLSLRRPADRGREARRFSLRFGLATLLAAGLLVISLSGWIKETLDAAREETALLAELSQAESRFRMERRAPGFPWMFFSTDALPLDAPLKSISFSQSPSPEVLDRLLRRWPEVDVVPGPRATTGKDDFDRDDASLVAQIEALPGLMPQFPQYGDDPSAIEPLPTGTRLDGETRKNVIDMARECWARAAQTPPPPRYAVREELQAIHADGSLATFRDGERYRLADGASGEMETFDGRFRRRLQRMYRGWRLRGRWSQSKREVDPPPFRRKYANWTYGFEEETASGDYDGSPWLSYSTFEPDLGGALKEVRLPRMPFCVPPCLDGVVPDLDEALRRATPQDVVSVEKIDRNRYRIDLLFPRAPGEEVPDLPRDEASEERPWVTEFAVVLRADLDWAVERCEYVDEFAAKAPGEAFGGGAVHQYGALIGGTGDAQEPDRDVRRERRFRIFNVLDGSADVPRYDGAGFVCESYDDNSLEKRFDGYAFYAIAFPEELPEAVFDRVALADPAPPVPEAPSAFRWYFATAAFGAIVMTIGPFIRKVGAARGGRAPVAAGNPRDLLDEEAV